MYKKTKMNPGRGSLVNVGGPKRKCHNEKRGLELTIPHGSRFCFRSRIKALVNYVLCVLVVSTLTISSSESSTRVPAEWEPQEAIWLQWPGRYEKTYEPAFAKMAKVIMQYEKLHILHTNERIKQQAIEALTAVDANVNHNNLIWHQVRNDSAWMRDNGPVYVIKDGELRIQNWEFDAWGGAFGSYVPYAADNRVPDYVGKYLDIPVDQVDIVHERGNLEFNGDGAVILNWSTLGDFNRNPGYTKAQAEQDLKQHFGLDTVIFIEGIPAGDLTKGHVDGIARFISKDKVVIPYCTGASKCNSLENGNADIYDEAAAKVAAAGFEVIRDPIDTRVYYRDAVFDANYMNWIVGNGFVIAVGFGNQETDQAAKTRIESYYPGRDVYIIEMLESWYNGGGAHCHTNDQPAFP